MNRSVIIIGAGPGGLASAILLASAGVRVKLLERMPMVGGRTSAFQADGFTFDLGPTFFLYPRVLDEIFAAAGASLRKEVNSKNRSSSRAKSSKMSPASMQSSKKKRGTPSATTPTATNTGLR